MVVREFQSGDEAVFRSLNEEWITRYFRLETMDEKALGNPRETILENGGRIFFATVDDKCVGCCALLRKGDAEFEIGKMAVTPAHQGSGIGRRLLIAAIEAAQSAGTRRLYLETNHTLTPALTLYESMGFQRLPAERVKPSPYERSTVAMELFLK
jgi:putative acetyltransferase